MTPALGPVSRRWALLGIPALLLLVAAATRTRETFRSGVFDPPRAAPDFELRGSTGGPLTLRAHRGKVVAIAFGFTYCPRICPVTLAKLAEVRSRLGPRGKDLDVIFVTVDPDRDSPARLREFLDFFDPAFVGGTGDETALRALHHAYGVTAERVVSEDPKLGYEMHHSTSVYLVDRSGKLRLLAPFALPAEDLLHDVEALIET